MEIKEQIINKVKKYIIETLEPSRPELFGFSACPFVKSERINNRIMYDILNRETRFLDLVKKFDESDYTTGLFIQTLDKGEIITPEEGLQYERFIDTVMKENGFGKYKSICFNPQESLGVRGFCPRSEAPYFLINIALREDLEKAHETLLKTKYFDNFPEKYKKYLQF